MIRNQHFLNIYVYVQGNSGMDKIKKNPLKSKYLKTQKMANIDFVLITTFKYLKI